MLSDDDIQAQVLAVFRAEQAEHRQAIIDILLDLERTPDHPRRRELIDHLFRAAHSLKGGAHAADVKSVEQIAHQIEHIFAALRQNQLTLTADICDVIYQALEVIGALMEQAVPGQINDQDALDALLAHLMSIGQHMCDGEAATPSLSTSETRPQQSAPSLAPERSVRVDVAVLDNLMREMGELLTSTLRTCQLARDLQELPDCLSVGSAPGVELYRSYTIDRHRMSMVSSFRKVNNKLSSTCSGTQMTLSVRLAQH
ncbi:Hpt domain-containing protein [Chloroflexus sp.]|uniref:Hpt domain-containing protein n=1 Tax=Chloroflexus sp. TaxID=1904827 RepID=UPI002ADDA7FD|nr:Hpt domain-containing protein [Chloroflexus sp.]